MAMHARSPDLASERPLQRGRLRPRVRLKPRENGAVLDVRAARSTQVLVLLHVPPCAGCAAFVSALAEAAPEIGSWDARVALIGPADGDPPGWAAAAQAPDMARYADPRGNLSDMAPGIIVADAWGEVYLAESAGERHAWPDAAEIVEAVRFVAVQCPECEVPEGPWRRV